MHEIKVKGVGVTIDYLWYFFTNECIFCIRTAGFDKYTCQKNTFLPYLHFQQKIYIRYASQLKRLENVLRSPIFHHFEESIVGASSIRSYGRERQFIHRCETLIDDSQKPYYLLLVAQRWDIQCTFSYCSKTYRGYFAQ